MIGLMTRQGLTPATTKRHTREADEERQRLAREGEAPDAALTSQAIRGQSAGGGTYSSLLTKRIEHGPKVSHGSMSGSSGF